MIESKKVTTEQIRDLVLHSDVSLDILPSEDIMITALFEGNTWLACQCRADVKEPTLDKLPGTEWQMLSYGRPVEHLPDWADLRMIEEIEAVARLLGFPSNNAFQLFADQCHDLGICPFVQCRDMVPGFRYEWRNRRVEVEEDTLCGYCTEKEARRRIREFTGDGTYIPLTLPHVARKNGRTMVVTARGPGLNVEVL